MSGAEADSKQETLSRFITTLRDTSPSSTGLLQSLLAQHEKWILKEQDKNDGKTVLHHAVELPHRNNLLDSFLTKCPEAAQLVDKKGQTPGHIVVKNCYKKSFDILWSKNAMLSYDWDDDGYTLLHYACMTIFPDETNPSKMICADPGAPMILEKILQHRPVLCLVKSQDGQLPIDMLPDQRLKALCEYYTLMGTQIVIDMATNDLFSDVVDKHVREKTNNKYLPSGALATTEKTQASLKVAKQVLSHERLQLHLRRPKLGLRQGNFFRMLISRLVPRGWSGFESDDFGQPTNHYQNSSNCWIKGFGFGGEPFEYFKYLSLLPHQVYTHFGSSGNGIYIRSTIELKKDSNVTKEIELFTYWRNETEWLRKERGDKEQNRESMTGNGANSEKVSKSQGELKKSKDETEQKADNAEGNRKLKLELLLDQKELHLSMAKKLYDYAGKTKNLCDGELNDAVNDLLSRAFNASCKFADVCDSIVSQHENGAVDGKDDNHDAGHDTPGASKGETKVGLLDLQMKKETLDEMADVLFGFAEQIRSICGESNGALNELLNRALQASFKANNTAHTIAGKLFS